MSLLFESCKERAIEKRVFEDLRNKEIVIRTSIPEKLTYLSASFF